MRPLYELSKVMVAILGPLLLACIVIMYVSVTLTTKKPPKPSEVIYRYIQQSMAKSRHAGVMTYLLVVGALFFFVAVAMLAAGHLGVIN